MFLSLTNDLHMNAYLHQLDQSLKRKPVLITSWNNYTCSFVSFKTVFPAAHSLTDGLN